MDPLRIGTCSWKYDAWKGLVYPDEKNFNYLEAYAGHYNTVEIDQWFWSLHGEDKISLPKPRIVEEYIDSVPDDFKFSVKIPNSVTLTHFYKKSKNEPLRENPYFLSLELFEEFLDRLKPMKDRLGPLMFQFEYLNKQKMPSRQAFQARFGDFVSRCPKGFIYCVETRNPNYLHEGYFDFLNRHGLRHVFLQGYYMPSIFKIYDRFAEKIQGLTVIRLHGPGRKDIEAKSKGEWNRIIEPREDDLGHLKGMLRHLQSREVMTYLNVNNHFEGSAPLTIQRIQSILQKA
jgi:uncharacterized protein YecE (DUF72 family)